MNRHRVAAALLAAACCTVSVPLALVFLAGAGILSIPSHR
jgi:hypothetical protein